MRKLFCCRSSVQLLPLALSLCEPFLLSSKIVTSRPRPASSTSPDSTSPIPSSCIPLVSCVPNTRGGSAIMNRVIATDLPAPVHFLPLIPHVSANFLIEIRLGYVLLAYNLCVTALILGFNDSTLSQRLIINVLLKSCISVLFMILVELVSMWLSSLCKDSPRFY